MAAPFQNHMGTKVNPCVIINGVSGPCHLLACGHIVIINHGNWSCAQNCRHVVDSNSLGHPRFNGHTLTDHLYCTICNQNEPITIFKARHAQSADIQNLRHTMPMTRETLKSVPGFCAERLEYEPPLSILCLEYSHYDGNGIDPMHTHRLLCGHEVFVWPSRPCAANCHQAEPRCRGHAHPQNRVQADAILCQLCVQKAESGVAQYRWPRTL
ncbi:hypothetical protein B0J11DRAFT_499418 [Dendryphion nanum]|uniref:Uncharacterized protein n=1 Tax=Dendryphion nanum TaxID=256645 RepID=A0A9P9I803_9PLEO|nr:hypothetical protein B0J11DRAFT_499418 [Dendryphion nanum]